ncbi:unnamed protein product [Cyprideis torosa]|uniref:Uncharacterized protein n=1 Tax=Cyprideis torosa TaxID=163714 RepID=A0A7R8WMH4_9CRUS|nr:unnamed protein product [Cyprideis torosa]CAG0905307.1 unnamed protein product [Cyprideis torosa]
MSASSSASPVPSGLVPPTGGRPDSNPILAPMKDYEIIIIGSGFGGQVAAINLKKRGIDNFRILERRDFMGGTWCQNTYPGAAVDVQSPLYSISFEPYPWSQMLAEQDELETYTNRVIEKYGIKEKTKTHHNVNEIRWNDEEKLWYIEIEGKDTHRCNYIINATGPLSTPVIPNFKGKENFAGKSFHSNNWDHSYDYKGKRVAIIGSGASAAQIIPTIAPDVAELHVFQRTPHWVMPRPDRVFKPWERNLLKIPFFYKLLREGIYWSLETRILGFIYNRRGLKATAQRKAKAFLNEQVKDPELRKKLKPDFTIGCKRILLSNTYYPALCRENTFLYTKDHQIKEITESGITTSQDEHIDLDLIVYATGYDATDGVISYPVIGRNGLSMQEYWSDFPRAYLGTTIPDFPNLFIVTGPNTGIGHTSAIHIIESQMFYIFNCLKRARKSNKHSIEVKKEAEDRYTHKVHEKMKKTVWYDGGCNSWYKSKSGKVIAMFPDFSFIFRRLAKNFKAEDHILS